MSLLDDFIKLRIKKRILAEEYEQIQSYEMAYIALWSVTELTVKAVEESRKTSELKDRIRAWHHFFENNSNISRPEPIKSFVCEVKTIPAITLIQKSLGEVPALAKLLQTNQRGKSSKYRDKRNAIAHNADKFKNIDIYLDYKETALAAIEELELKLKGMKEK
ncbi:hypothetical protein [Providencia sp. PROV273]|uniref:hypothetical protein n=1 Tax=Providencia sp. PROV273 TaxID=2949960 RepID=UPI00234B5618|nr:hypothetical protein [Providencia sp. PROV273]